MKTKLTRLLIGLFCLVHIQLSYGQTNFLDGTYIDEGYANTLPSIAITSQSEATILPPEVDNTLLPFFPHNPDYPDQLWFWDQKNTASCGPSSLVFYTYTYEFNRQMNTSANSYDRIFAPNFMFNFLNQGIIDTGTYLPDNLKFIQKCGSLDFAHWISLDAEEYLKWVNGYDNYLEAFNHKIKTPKKLFLENDSTLTILKHYLNDHGEGAATGGIASFCLHVYGAEKLLVPPSSHIEEPIWIGDDGGDHSHMITIVGYSDNVGWDFDGDGIISSNAGKPMKEWEYGALKLANSKGNNWYRGYIWIPYRNFGLNPECIYFLTPDSTQSPRIILKESVTCNKRDEFSIVEGWGPNACVSNYTPPLKGVEKFFDKSGGNHPMDGYTNATLEFGYDWGYFFSDYDFGKIFNVTIMAHVVPNSTLNSLSMIDYRWNEIFEIPFKHESPFPQNLLGFQKWTLEYHLFPFQMTSNKTYTCNMVSRFSPTVSNNATLTLGDGIKVDLYNSDIHITEGSTLIVGDSVSFIAKQGSNLLVIDGNVQFGDNVKFYTEDGVTFIVIINGTCNGVALNNAMFHGVGLQNFCHSLQVTNSVFNSDNYIFSDQGNIQFDGCTFNNYMLNLFNYGPERDDWIEVTNCIFTNSNNSYEALYINNYQNYYITENTFFGGSSGIFVSDGGFGQPGHHQIKNNIIINCLNTGICIMNSVADIRFNNISNCHFGVCLYDNSQTILKGNPDATISDQTQEITDNSSYELYASTGSFPSTFRFNYIVDEDNLGNPTDPMIYYDGEPGGVNDFLHAELNCWGVNFSPHADFRPASMFQYLPILCPPFDNQQVSGDQEELFTTADSLFQVGDYSGAETSFIQLINDYPHSFFANESVKKLFSLEHFLGGNYETLQSFYLTNDSILTDSTLSSTAVFFANKCDIKLANWPEAITFHEDRILNPVSFQDSIFGIIDLGNVYLQMGSFGNKATYMGKLSQYKPNSINEQKATTKELLSLLPGDNTRQYPKKVNSGLYGTISLSTHPNPCSTQTVVSFVSSEFGEAVIRVTDMLGEIRIIKTIPNISIGFAKEVIHISGLAPGLYMFSLEINNKFIAAQKVIISD